MNYIVCLGYHVPAMNAVAMVNEIHCCLGYHVPAMNAVARVDDCLPWIPRSCHERRC